MKRNATHPSVLVLMSVMTMAGLHCPTTNVLCDDDLPSATEAARHGQLTQRRVVLTNKINRYWQQGDDSKAYQGLQDLLLVLKQTYPVSEFPKGHRHIVSCYRDLYRVSQELENIDAMLKNSQEGLVACQNLFKDHQFPHGHPETAGMLANVGHAWMQHGRPARARDRILQALEMSEDLQKHGSKGFDAQALADLCLCLATTYVAQGDSLTTLQYTQAAVKHCQDVSSDVPYLDRVRTSARCLVAHGRALSVIGNYQAATDVLQQALDLCLRDYFARLGPVSRLALIDAHIELGILHRHKSDIPIAKSHLLKAQQLIDKTGDLSVRNARRKNRCLVQLLWLADMEGNQADMHRHANALQGSCPMEFVADARDRRSCTEAELQRAVALHLLGKTDQAMEHCRAALQAMMTRDHFESKPDSLEILANDLLADIYCATGRYERACFHYKSAFSLTRQLFARENFTAGHRLLASAAHDAATQYWLLGETESAATLYREAMLMNERLYPPEDYPRGHRQLMAAYSAWGNVLERDGDLAGAAEYFAKAHQIALAQFPESEYPLGHDELASVWRGLGRLNRLQGHFDLALDYFHRSLASYEKRYTAGFPDGHLLIALALGEVGRTHCAAGDYERAEQSHQRSLALRRRLFPVVDYPVGHPSLAAALRDLGRVFHASARYDKAFHAFAESAGMEQSVAESFVGGGSEALLLNLAARKFESLDCLLESWRHSQRPAAEAYQHVWRRRGFVPRLIAQRHRALQQFEQASGEADREAYLKVRRELSRALLASASRDDLGGPELEIVRRLNAQKEDLEARLMRQLISFDQKAAWNEHTPRQLAEQLPQGAVLVDYVKYVPERSAAAFVVSNGAAQMLAFVITGGEPIACVSLGDADPIENVARQWREAVLEGRGNGSGHELRRLVWDTVSACFPVGTETVYVAPDGELSTVPWHALPLSEGSRLLIEQYAIATVPHGVFLLDSLSHSPSPDKRQGPILAVGDLDFGHRASNDGGRAHGLKQVTWRPLGASGKELDDLAVVAGDRNLVRLSGSDGSVETVIRLLPTCRWAHFATHGFFIDDALQQSLQLAASFGDRRELVRNRSRASVLRRSPFVQSGLALSGANVLGKLDAVGVPLEATGILTAEAIATVDCSGLELVVLSACESGRGDVVRGDGVFGIQTAFHVAGARNVIASIWKIDDQATADLMKAFYQLLWTEAKSPLEALRGAQLKMLHQSRSGHQKTRGPVLAKSVPLPKAVPDRVSANARLWAGFVLSGPGF